MSMAASMAASIGVSAAGTGGRGVAASQWSGAGTRRLVGPCNIVHWASSYSRISSVA